MRVSWDVDAWDQYVVWQAEDRKTLKRINLLIADIKINGYTGIGKPEALLYDLTGWWSRRINEMDRLVYRIREEEDEILIASCRYHYV